MESDSEDDQKVLNRELGRLRASLECGVENGGELVVFLHYPPVFCNQECTEIIDILLEYGVKRCFYGHIHGASNIKNACEGNYRGIDFRLVSCDRLAFSPKLVSET